MNSTIRNLEVKTVIKFAEVSAKSFIVKNTHRHIEIIGTLVFLFFALSGNAQNCDISLAEAINDQNRIYVTESTDVSKRELRRETNKVQQELLNDLRVIMAEKILTEVKSVTVSGITESGEMHESFFNNETEITSAAILSEGETEFCVDQKNKRMYGIYSLNRKELQQKHLATV